MDPETIGKLAGVADKITSFALMLIVLVSGSRGMWVWGEVAKEKDRRIGKLEQKIEAQERLIDRLSGVADRSIDLSTSAVVRQVREHHRHREDAA